MHSYHTEEKPLVFFSEGSLIVLAFTFDPPTFFGASESTVFVASANGAHICSCRAACHGNLRITHHGSKLHHTALDGYMIHSKLVLHLRFDLWFRRRFWRTDIEVSLCFKNADLPLLGTGIKVPRAKKECMA